VLTALHSCLVFARGQYRSQPVDDVAIGALLAAIALAPLFFANWWGKHYTKVAFGLAAIVLAYYLFGIHAPGRVLAAGHEYVSFIALIGSLFVVFGRHPYQCQRRGVRTVVNVVFLLIGAVIANLLGTTGASMLLIRPWIRMNKYRITAHHIVFFIFIVSNVGGCLTPIGDPPLFLGYLYGIPFWWVAEHCLPMWATGIGICWRCFTWWIALTSIKRRAVCAPKKPRMKNGALTVFPMLLFLAVILVSVFVNNPTFPARVNDDRGGGGFLFHDEKAGARIQSF